MGEKKRLGEILVEDYHVLPEDLTSAVSAQRYVPDRLGVLLVRMGVLTERDLVTALGQQLRCPVVLGLPKRSIPEEVIALVPMAIAEKKLCIPLGVGTRTRSNGREQQVLILAMADPTDSATRDAVERLAGMRVLVAIAPEEDVRRALKVFYFADPIHRDMSEVSESFELIRAIMHERTGTGRSFSASVASVPAFPPAEVGSTAA